MLITKKPFGQTKHNQPVSIYCLQNSKGSYVEILDYGCRVHSIHVPDRNGVLQDVCLGYQSLQEYEKDDAYFGAVVGRCANLISNACFSLNGMTYLLDSNAGNHHLHGGKNGFSFCLWNGVAENGKLVFTRCLSDNADGYPGNLNMKVSYEWTDDNRLHITYEGSSDQDTILNVTNHTYFNLSGLGNSSVLEHELWLDADYVAEINHELLPTGNLLCVEGTPFDFRIPKTLVRDINEDHPQLTYGCGYDHNFVRNNDGFRRVAMLHSPGSGISVTCYTDRPCIQIYTCNDLSPRTGKYGEKLGPHSGVCLETQHYTNAVNMPKFPSVVLKAQEWFYSQTTYAFDTLL